MRKKRHIRRSLLWFLLAIFIGMGGLLIAGQFSDQLVRFTLVLISVAVPLFTGGIFMARYASEGVERFVLVAGVLMLLIGAAASMSDMPNRVGDEQWFSTGPLSLLGICSLMLGLFVVLFSVVRTGKAIDEIEERFRHIAEHISEGFILSSPDGRIVLVNQRCLDMIGCKEEDIVGEHASDLVTRLNIGAMAPHLDLRAKGVASEYEVTWNVRGEERQLWVSGTPIFDRKGHHMGTLATMRDMTERRKMAAHLELYARGLQELVEEQTQKLRRSEEQLRGLLVHMNEGFMTLDAAYRVKFVNNRMCELLRTGADNVMGRDVLDFVEPQSKMKLIDQFQNASLGHDIRPEINFLDADNQPLCTVVAVSSAGEDEETEARYALVVTDVSQLKEMQRQLELRAVELEAANEELRMHGRAKDGFLSNVSHELKTPLSTINGYLEMLQSGHLGSLEASQTNALSVMARNVHRLGGLISEMIEFSRMEIRGVQLHMTLVNIPVLLQECAASAKPQAMAKDIQIMCDLRDGFPPIWCDRSKMSQVLGIFLSNSVKFTSPGGKITIAVRESPGHAVEIDVGDTGIGIDHANHARVFEKFFQVDASMTRRYEGAGIGLSIAKSIVEAHGGVIKLDSELGSGSTFTVVLPGAVLDRTVPPAVADTLAELRVLVVSESDNFRNVIRHILGVCGCYVDEANNGYECLRLAEETEPQLVLFDELLADQTGAQVISGIRDSLVTSKVPVLIVCPENADAPRELTQFLPDIHLMYKPFTALGLVSRVQRICLNDSDSPVALDSCSRPELKTLVLDPDADLLEWVQTGLRHRKIACYSASDIERAVALARQNRPDVIFLDAEAPPFSLARKLEMLHSESTLRRVPVYLLTAGPQGASLPDSVQGILSKPFTLDEMVRIVENVHAAT